MVEPDSIQLRILIDQGSLIDPWAYKIPKDTLVQLADMLEVNTVDCYTHFQLLVKLYSTFPARSFLLLLKDAVLYDCCDYGSILAKAKEIKIKYDGTSTASRLPDCGQGGQGAILAPTAVADPVTVPASQGNKPSKNKSPGLISRIFQTKKKNNKVNEPLSGSRNNNGTPGAGAILRALTQMTPEEQQATVANLASAFQQGYEAEPYNNISTSYDPSLFVNTPSGPSNRNTRKARSAAKAPFSPANLQAAKGSLKSTGLRLNKTQKVPFTPANLEAQKMKLRETGRKNTLSKVQLFSPANLEAQKMKLRETGRKNTLSKVQLFSPANLQGQRESLKKTNTVVKSGNKVGKVVNLSSESPAARLNRERRQRAAARAAGTVAPAYNARKDPSLVAGAKLKAGTGDIAKVRAQTEAARTGQEQVQMTGTSAGPGRVKVGTSRRRTRKQRR
jgi:hypothetical protein